MSSNAALHVFQFRYKELNGITTGRANHVVVRSTVQAVFVTRHPVVKIHLVGEATLDKQFESAINSRIADARIALPCKSIQLLDAEMITRGEEYVENAVALGAPFEAFFAEAIGKKAHSLCYQICAIRMRVVDAIFSCGTQGFLLRRL